jgi:hypothetical protein
VIRDEVFMVEISKIMREVGDELVFLADQYRKQLGAAAVYIQDQSLSLIS